MLLDASQSYESAEKAIELLTGIKVGHSSQHRLVQSDEIEQRQAKGRVMQMSVDGGKVRLRGVEEEGTRKRGVSPCRDYKAVCAEGKEKVCAAFFQDNQACIEWSQSQAIASMVTCVGDGHDGVWNLIGQMVDFHQRREVLDWYHLVENLYGVGGSLKRLKKVKGYLWNGLRSERRV